jgi:hypothetical protein
MNDTVIFEFTILYDGWEMDNIGWVMERPDGSRYIRSTNHGSYCEMMIEDLEDKIREYEQVTQSSKYALNLIRGFSDER